MTSRWDLVVFDWDGTLMDSTAAITRAIQAACREVGVPEPARAQASFVIGLGLVDALRHVAPDVPAADYERIAQAYRRHYFAQADELVLFDGVATLLRELREQGARLAVATGKSRTGLELALEQSGLRGLFDTTRTADETASKPHPQMLLEIMDELVAPADSTLMIGDTTHDLQMARNAGTPAVGVSYGAHRADELSLLQPLRVVDSVAELRSFLLAHD
jgi:phosphoglycolate phosphatase